MSPRPFALGTFAAGSRDDAFAGLVVDRAVVDLRALLGSVVSVRALLEHWDRSFERLQQLADDFDPEPGESLETLRPLPPVLAPGQIFQAGANYRQHVLDLMSGAEHRGDESDGLTSGE